MTSTAPIKCMQRKYNNTYELVVDQIMELQNIINKNSSDDFIKINYEELCVDPNAVVEKIKAKAKVLGINMKIKNKIKSFKVSSIDKDKNNDTKILYNLISEKNK